MSRTNSPSEFALIDRLVRRLPPRQAATVLGPGDDTAAVMITPGRLVLATCDALVEGRHFQPDWLSPYDLGRRALAVNLSDIAAMGGRPRFALVSLLLPGDLSVEYLEAVYDGLAAEARRFAVDIVGGNISRSPGGLCLDITVLGEVLPGQLLRRSGAQPGDIVFVTGVPGTAAAGRSILAGETPPARDATLDAPLLAAYRTPTPRLEIAQHLAEWGCLTALQDISDGLAADLGHICDASGVGVRVEAAALPRSPALQAAAARAGRDLLDWILGGGDDYELIFTASPRWTDDLLSDLPAQTGVPIHRIGVITPPADGRWLIGPQGTGQPLAPAGWDHLRAP